MASTNHIVDHTTLSEHLRTTALPENRAAMIGDQALCRARKGESDTMLPKLF